MSSVKAYDVPHGIENYYIVRKGVVITLSSMPFDGYFNFHNMYWCEHHMQSKIAQISRFMKLPGKTPSSRIFSASFDILSRSKCETSNLYWKSYRRIVDGLDCRCKCMRESGVSDQTFSCKIYVWRYFAFRHVWKQRCFFNAIYTPSKTYGNLFALYNWRSCSTIASWP